jgi:hypothetical protein
VPTIQKIIEELQWLSDRISTQVRTLGISLLAITWGLIIAQPQIAGPLPDDLKKSLLIVGVLALAAIICDFLQYSVAYLNNKALLDNMEDKKLDEAAYDYTATTYKLRGFFFWAKQVLLIIACAWFLIIIIPFCIKAVVGAGTSVCT